MRGAHARGAGQGEPQRWQAQCTHLALHSLQSDATWAGPRRRRRGGQARAAQSKALAGGRQAGARCTAHTPGATWAALTARPFRSWCCPRPTTRRPRSRALARCACLRGCAPSWRRKPWPAPPAPRCGCWAPAAAAGRAAGGGRLRERVAELSSAARVPARKGRRTDAHKARTQWPAKPKQRGHELPTCCNAFSYSSAGDRLWYTTTWGRGGRRGWSTSARQRRACYHTPPASPAALPCCSALLAVQGQQKAHKRLAQVPAMHAGTGQLPPQPPPLHPPCLPP